jgi:hypothetical protein
MAFRCALHEFRDGIASHFGIAPEPQEHVIMTIENQLHAELPNGRVVFLYLKPWAYSIGDDPRPIVQGFASQKLSRMKK